MYIDLLTKIKNAQLAKKESLKTPYSNMDLAVAELLERHKFVESVAKKGKLPKLFLDIKLRYNDGEGAIQDIVFLSKPSRRLYIGHRDIKPVRQGYGLLIISTPKGIMDGKTARKQKLGGQLLFKIW